MRQGNGFLRRRAQTAVEYTVVVAVFLLLLGLLIEPLQVFPRPISSDAYYASLPLSITRFVVNTTHFVGSIENKAGEDLYLDNFSLVTSAGRMSTRVLIPYGNTSLVTLAHNQTLRANSSFSLSFAYNYSTIGGVTGFVRSSIPLEGITR